MQINPVLIYTYVDVIGGIMQRKGTISHPRKGKTSKAPKKTIHHHQQQ